MIDDKGYLIKANLYDGLDCDDDIIFYQNDTRQSKIVAEFTGKKRAAIDVADCTVVCVIQKSDKEIVTAYMENDFNVANRAEYVLSQNALASTGKGIITIFVYGSDNERQTFGSIKFKVLKDVNSGSVESTTEYPVLTKLISDAKVATNGAESAKNEILGISADIANAEKQRNIAETKREESESNRSKEFTGIKKEYESLKGIMIDENNAANLQNQINEANSQLDNVESEIKSKEVNVLFPPLGYLPLIVNDDTKSEENKKRLNELLDHYNNELVTLFFPKGTYYLLPTIRIKKNIRIKGDSTRNGTKFKDNSAEDIVEPFLLFSMSDDNIEDASLNRIWGCEMKDVFISGNSQNHDAIQFIKTGWEGKIDNVWIEGFGGRALYLQDVYDTVWNNITIFNCGGLINGTPNYAIELNGINNVTNAQHFNNLHIEDCRYMIKFGKNRHNYFINSKFEQNKVNEDNENPVLNITADSMEVNFIGCMLALNAVTEYTNNNAPYVIKGFNSSKGEGITKFIGCDFATGNASGMKLVDTNDSSINFDNCSVYHLHGDRDSIKLNGKSSFINSRITCRVLGNGVCSPISIGNATFKNIELKCTGGTNSISSACIILIDNDFIIEDIKFDSRFNYKVNNDGKYLGRIIRNKGVIPNYSSVSSSINLGSLYNNIFRVNATSNIDITNIIGYSEIGEEVLIYNSSSSAQLIFKHLYNGLVANTGQMSMKESKDLWLSSGQYVRLKWIGDIWIQI